MTTANFEPLMVRVPLREGPDGVFRVGNTRVLLELVLDAYKRGESPEAIVRSYRAGKRPHAVIELLADQN